MVRNLGTVDRVARFVAAIVVVVLYAAGVISGWLAVVLGVLALVLLVTSLIGYCPLYALLRISSKR